MYHHRCISSQLSEDHTDVGDLYFVARKLKAYTERTLGAEPGDIEAVPLHRRLLLRQVLESPGATIADLSTQLSLAQSMVSTAVSALRQQGLVTTEIDSADRRRVKVAPSKKLQSWAQTRLHRDLEVVLEPLLRDVPAKDRTCVLRAIGVLNQSFRKLEEERPLVLSGNGSRTSSAGRGSARSRGPADPGGDR
jgi:DNA-binding MarR family transcriptional regulator